MMLSLAPILRLGTSGLWGSAPSFLGLAKRALSRNKVRHNAPAGLVLSLVLVLLFSYGPVFSQVKNLVPRIHLQSTSNIYLIHLGLLMFWSVLILAGGYFIIKARR